LEAGNRCGGAQSYAVLRDEIGCEVTNAKAEEGSFFNINTVNSYHAFIKENLDNYRGVATKYLNRYNALFAKIFRHEGDPVEYIYTLLTSSLSSNYHSVAQVKCENLLRI
jgi:hypothetical protein